MSDPVTKEFEAFASAFSKDLGAALGAKFKERLDPITARLKEHADELHERRHQSERHAQHLQRLETKLTQLQARLDRIEGKAK